MRNTSLALFVYGCVVVACRIAFARLPDRVPSLALAAVTLVVMAAGLLVIASWQTPAGLLVGTVVMAVGVTFVTPALFAAMFATAKPSERGAAAGTASSPSTWGSASVRSCSAWWPTPTASRGRSSRAAGA